MGKCYIGTSGWQYSHWKGTFYPAKLSTDKLLNYYSQYFNTVEINFSFYRQPNTATYAKWQGQTSKNFIFSIKGNRFITHIKRIKNCQEALNIFFKNASILQGRHIILWQLPPNLKKDIPRLFDFLKLLPKTFRHAIEFRHQSWSCPATWKIMQSFNCAVVFQDWPGYPLLDKELADFIYLRFHGNKVLYISNYTDQELQEWAKRIKKWLADKKDIYAYFNNDAAAHAITNALMLNKILML